MDDALQVPRTLEGALDPKWLGAALAPLTGGAAVTRVETVEVLRTVATKVRFTVSLDGAARPQAFCLNGLLDVDENTAKGGMVTVLEADFYSRLAGLLPVRVPECGVRGALVGGGDLGDDSQAEAGPGAG